jgi:hypothetical protein
MHAPIIITLDQDNQLSLESPAKVAPFVFRALSRGLVAVQTDSDVDGGSSYSIMSTNPIDDWRLWIHFTPGRNGGRLNLVRYMPNPPKGRSTTAKLTIPQAFIQIDEMGEGLDRHNARVAQAEAALRQVGQELDGAAISTGVVTASVPSAPTSGVVRHNAVRELKAAPAVDSDAATRAEAQAVLGTLRANARFAVRAAHRGTIPRNTPAKVRHALVRRGLAGVAGGALTDLGRAVHQLILN